MNRGSTITKLDRKILILEIFKKMNIGVMV